MEKSSGLTNQHIPVLLEEIQSFFLPANSYPFPNIFDGTFGGGGYSRKFLQNDFGVFACDLDEQAIQSFYQQNLDLNKHPNLSITQANFADYIQNFNDNFFIGILLDLGFSSNQLASGGRGFSYLKTDEILDLRFNYNLGVAAWQKILQLKTPFDLQKILFTYSGESLSKTLAIVLFNLIHNTQKAVRVEEVVQALLQVIPKKFWHKKNAILSRVWQALRIWTNDEFTSLEIFLQFAPQKLQIGGFLAIVCFHSLEDKIVTKCMRQLSKPVEIDDFGNKQQNYKLLTSKPITTSNLEIQQNIRSRSAILRVLQKL